MSIKLKRYQLAQKNEAIAQDLGYVEKILRKGKLDLKVILGCADLLVKYKRHFIDIGNKALDLNSGKTLAVKPFRPLTYAERRVEFDELNDFINKHESELKAILRSITARQRDAVLKTVEALVDQKDIKGLKDLTTSLKNELNNELKAVAKTSLEYGKEQAASEISVETPATPTINTQVLDAQIDAYTKQREEEIVKEVKRTVLDNIAIGVGTAAILVAVGKQFDALTSTNNRALSGTVTTQYLNQGRSVVFNSKKNLIHGLQRSEVLDSKTCAICLSLDGRVLSTDDPFTKIGQIHTNCRGIWVAILKSDADLPQVKELPQTLKSRFQVAEGVPSINNFKQLKTPIINKTSRAGQKVADGDLDNNPNINVQ